MPDDDHSDTTSLLLQATREELLRLGTPASVLHARTVDAMRRAGVAEPLLTPVRRGQLMAQRETLFAYIDPVSLAVARALKHRRVPDDRRGDAAHDVLLRVADRGLLDGFDPDTARVDDDVTDPVTQHGLAIARYVAGSAWRVSINETRREGRRVVALQRTDPALEPQEQASPEVVRALFEVEARVRSTLSPIDFDIWLRCDVEREPHDEVAASLGLLVKSMETRLYRARARVKEALAERDVAAMLPLPIAAASGDALAAFEDRMRALAAPSDAERRTMRRSLDEALRGRLSTSRRWRDLSHAALGAAAGAVAALALSRAPAPPRPIAPTMVSRSTLVLAPPPQAPASRALESPAVRSPAAVVPPAPPRAVAPARPAPATRGSELAAESALIATARSALGRNPPRALEALASLDEHARRFPRGQLCESRDFLHVRALDALGRVDDARAEGDRFRGRYPDSIYVANLP